MLGPLRLRDILHVEPLLVTQGHEVPVPQLLTNLLLKCHKEKFIKGQCTIKEMEIVKPYLGRINCLLILGVSWCDSSTNVLGTSPLIH